MSCLEIADALLPTAVVGEATENLPLTPPKADMAGFAADDDDTWKPAAAVAGAVLAPPGGGAKPPADVVGGEGEMRDEVRTDGLALLLLLLVRTKSVWKQKGKYKYWILVKKL